MDVPEEEGLLVVNMQSCISSGAVEQDEKGGCVYTVAVASDRCSVKDEAVMQIPVSVQCSENEQQPYTVVAKLGGQHCFSDALVHHYSETDVTGNLQCVDDADSPKTRQQVNTNVDVLHSEEQPCLPAGVDFEESTSTNPSYYTEIFNYLTSQTVPEGSTESYKKALRKRAHNYKIVDGELYYGQKQLKRVITDREQQKEMLKNTHIEDGTGIHLGLKKMYIAISKFYFWKGLYIDVAKYVRHCKQCSETADIQTTDHAQSSQWSDQVGSTVGKVLEDKTARNVNMNKVWQKVELKIFGPYPKTVLQNEFIITITDPFSRWIVAHPVAENNHAEYIASFVYKTSCTFGFAKCNVVGVSEDVFVTAQTKYEDCVSRFQDTLLTCGLIVPRFTSNVHDLLVLLHDDLSQCSWVGKLLDDFVAANPNTWDIELERFLFEYCTTSGTETSPFVTMFGRSPIACLEEDKENYNVVEKERPVEVVSKRRRLQSSILQCRHCEEVFTSKISFRIHQRKHTDEARRQGTLEGQEPLGSVADRERRLKKTAIRRRQRLLRQDDENGDENDLSINNPNGISLVEDSLYSDNEVTNSASSMAEINVESESIQNVNTLTFSGHDSVGSCHNQVGQNNNKTCPVLSGVHRNEEQIEIGEVGESIQKLNPSEDINIVVYTETDMSPEIHSNNEVSQIRDVNETDQIESAEIQLEVINYPLSETQCEEGLNEEEAVENNTFSVMETVMKAFNCDSCGKNFSSKSRLIIHIEEHSNPLLKCNHCIYTTRSSKLFKYHQNIHNEKFKCKYCDKLFTRKIYMKYHIRDIHSKTRHLHNCEECSAKFMSLSGLKIHIQSVHEPLKVYPCNLCSYIGKSANSLASHTYRNHRKKYKCSTCDYSSLTQGGLDKHMRIYHNPDERQFECKHCSYRGLKRHQLLDHERIVHNQDKYKHMCPVCKKSFRTQLLMKHHLLSHSDQHFYSCRGCSYTTRYRQTLHLHIKHSHPGKAFKTLCNGPSDADFESIICSALENMEQYSSCQDQNMELNYTIEVPEDADHYMNISVLSEHSAPQDILNPHDTVSCNEDGLGSQLLTLSEYVPHQQIETVVNSTKMMENTSVTEEAVNSIQDLDTGTITSSQSVTAIDDSGLESGEAQRVVNLAGSVHVEKEQVHQLVTLTEVDTPRNLFPLTEFTLEDGEIHHVVRLVDSLGAIKDANEQSVTLLSNVQRATNAAGTVTHINLMENNPSQENFVILPLGDAKVAIIQNESFSAINADSHLVLNEHSALLDLIPQHVDAVPQQDNNINQVTVYHLGQ